MYFYIYNIFIYHRCSSSHIISICKLNLAKKLQSYKEKDAFVHASAVKTAGMRFLNEGDKLEFEMEDGPKGPSAINLKKID